MSSNLFSFLTKELLVEEYEVNKLTLRDIHLKYGIELRYLIKKMFKMNILSTLVCNRCNTSENLRKEKTGKVHSICNDCYTKVRKLQWANKSENEKEEISKKVGAGVKRAFKNDPSIIERKTITLKKTLENRTEEDRLLIQDKKEGTCIEKYGFKNPFQVPKFIEKTKETKIVRYGDENFKNIDKAMQTKFDRYGDSHYNNREKMESTYFERTGYHSPSENPEVREKSKQAYFEKTGYHSPYQNPEVRKKGELTTLERYGVTNIRHLYMNVSKISQELFWEIYNRLSSNLKEHCYFDSLNKEFGKRDNLSGKYYFYDFVITHLNFAIEFNGDYWHFNPLFYKETEIINNRRVSEVWKYDAEKIRYFTSLGFNCITIWENDYVTNRLKVIDSIMEKINI